MGVTTDLEPIPGQQKSPKSRTPTKVKVRRIITDDLEADSRTKEFKDLVTSLRAKANYVASRVHKQRKRKCRPIPITLCQVCGKVIVCQPRASHLKLYCGDTCRQLAKRRRDRFKAARMLTRMHPDETPVQFYIVVSIFNADDPSNTVRYAKERRR